MQCPLNVAGRLFLVETSSRNSFVCATDCLSCREAFLVRSSRRAWCYQPLNFAVLACVEIRRSGYPICILRDTSGYLICILRDTCSKRIKTKLSTGRVGPVSLRTAHLFQVADRIKKPYLERFARNRSSSYIFCHQIWSIPFRQAHLCASLQQKP